ncbi:MAG: hypothetical protein ACRDH5_08985, partial [bacterium]
MVTRIESPDDMRHAVADYVATIHRAYLSATAHLDSEVARTLPLRAAGEFSVLAVGAGDLHLIATAQGLPPGPEVEASDDVGGLRWRLRFYDPVVLPALDSITAGSDAADKVRRALGLEHWIYHLVAAPSAGLSVHNAFHAGAALAEGQVR